MCSIFFTFTFSIISFDASQAYFISAEVCITKFSYCFNLSCSAFISSSYNSISSLFFRSLSRSCSTASRFNSTAYRSFIALSLILYASFFFYSNLEQSRPCVISRETFASLLSYFFALISIFFASVWQLNFAAFSASRSVSNLFTIVS